MLVGLSLCTCGVAPPAERPASPSIPPEIERRPMPAPDLLPVAKQAGQQSAKKYEVPEAAAIQPAVTDNDRSIFFPPSSAAVGDDEKEKLRVCAEQLKQNPKQAVVLVGYSDDLGSKSYNLAITEQRIVAVGSVLRSLGVDRGQIRRNRSNSVKTAVQRCRTEECYRQLRRVEFVCGA